ncbi:hypothetical protein AURDEDRAFT_161589 [Auricularia subglabra TFB-10046 SS5]|nr:hypothetical protein AURDEDRAFT_161589 [Auricularia subglabra TFB-10046 SS5]
MSPDALVPSYNHRVTSIEPSWADLECDDDDTHFWHRSTLVLLDINLSYEQRLRSAVGKAVELWRSSARTAKHLTAFIISLQSVVEVHISDDSASHSALVELCGAVTESQPPFETSSHTPGFALLKRHFTPALPALDADPRCGLPLEVLERIFDVCDDTTLATLALTSKAVRIASLMRPRFTVGKHRLLHHVSGNEFTALDERGATIPVVVGKVACTIEGDIAGGHGFNLVLDTEDRDGVLLSLMGLRCVPKELGGPDAALLSETPHPDWRLCRLSDGLKLE